MTRPVTPCLTLIGGLLLPLASLAAQSRPFTIADAVATTLASHPAMAAADAARAGTRAGVRQARASWWPSLTVDGSATRFEEPMIVAPLHGFDPTRPPVFDQSLWQANLSVAWSLFDPQRGARIDRARAEESVSGATERLTREGLIARAVVGFLEAATAREMMTFHDGRVAALETERNRARQFVREGRTARLAEIRADAALAAAQADRIAAKGRLDASLQVLERLVGLPPGSLADRALAGAAVVGADTSLARSAVLAAVEAGNPELARRAGRVAALRAARADARGAWLPQLRVVGRVVQYGSGKGSEAAEWQTGVAVSYPLFTGGARSAASDRASAELAGAEAELAAARRDLGDAVDRALTGWTAARGRVAALRAAEAQAAEVARMERLALDQGAGVQTDYLAAQADLLRARAALAEARATVVAARVELARLAGELSLEWLGAHLESDS
ncbi:MAG: TolC family protein [Gemmatimonadetes bacterium]|nr:TolC family protein [Gemmatimonadota bacterium]MCC7132882.1 TolC family protein [Gemmatimonadales bacterium]